MQHSRERVFDVRELRDPPQPRWHVVEVNLEAAQKKGPDHEHRADHVAPKEE